MQDDCLEALLGEVRIPKAICLREAFPSICLPESLFNVAACGRPCSCRTPSSMQLPAGGLLNTVWLYEALCPQEALPDAVRLQKALCLQEVLPNAAWLLEALPDEVRPRGALLL